MSGPSRPSKSSELLHAKSGESGGARSQTRQLGGVRGTGELGEAGPQGLPTQEVWHARASLVVSSPALGTIAGDLPKKHFLN
jgi:hypothetical protein